MKKEALISIIIPVYNVEKYLNTCVYSVIYQTYQNLEIILVDDGSTDNSGKLCDELMKLDKRIKVIHKINGGLSDARNAGIEIANGEYIGFVDSDDWISTKMYEVLHRNIVECGADISVCERIIVSESGIDDKGVSGSRKVLETSDSLDILYKNEKYYSHAWNKLFKRNLFKEIRFPTGKLFEDIYIMHELFGEAKSVVFYDVGLYYYRQRSGSIVNSQNWKNYQEYIEAIQYRLNSKYSHGKERLVYKNLLVASKDVKSLIYKSKVNYESKELNKYINTLIRRNFKLHYGFKILINVIIIIYLFKEYEILRKLKNSSKVQLIKMKLNPIKIGSTNSRQRIILMGTPEYNNLGDLAIGYSIKKFIQNNFQNTDYIEIPEKYIRNNILPHRICKDDILLLMGGGNFGDVYIDQQYIRKLVISKYKQNRIIIFPQTIYFTKTNNSFDELKETKHLLANCDNVVMFARERFSFEVMKREFSSTNIFLSPDIVLFNKMGTFRNREGILYCIRNDTESVLSVDDREHLLRLLYRVDKYIDIWDTCLPYNIYLQERDQVVEEAMSYVGRHKIIITDRLHGIIFAAVTGTPCVAIENYNYKISGIYEWVKGLGYIYLEKNLDNIPLVAQQLLDKYPNGDYERISEVLFDKLKEEIKGEF